LSKEINIIKMSSNNIQGNPTKTFFIEMITRDISIKDAILDLLDNSIDGANRKNPNNYSGLYIDILISDTEFIVKDNCGGFSLETAKKYAFRFGRPDDAPKAEGSVGRFGVGMKRALFKIGHNFEVESKSNQDHFQIDVDVAAWKSKKKHIKLENDTIVEEEDWSFTSNNITDSTTNITENGTYIRVENLNKEVASTFSEPSFISGLKKDIERLLNLSLEKGIKIILNGEELDKKGIVIFNDASKPYVFEGKYDNVSFKVVAGLSYVGDPSSSGWYIYCNDRLVLEADTSEITGWDSGGIPKFHTDYVMFKGVVFLDSEETIDLPLTTTKRGIDATSEIYKKTLFYMREGLSSVLAFLKKVRKFGDEANNYRKLLGEQEDKIAVIELKDLVIESPRLFVEPKIDMDIVAEKNDWCRISFTAHRETADLAKRSSGTSNYKQLGEYVFDYYLKMEELEKDE
jgi:Histidine kinase-, DNA gyrase B-, and HSP90-like ATPase